MSLKSGLAAFFRNVADGLDKENKTDDLERVVEDAAAKSASEEVNALDKILQADVGSKDKSKDESVLIRSMLSHNVRMPLSIIAGYGNLLSSGLIEEGPKKEEVIRKICGNIKYLSNVLSLIIDGNERTGINYNFEDMDLVKCVRETAGYVLETAKRFGVRVQVNSSRENVLISGDYTQIMRVIFNLFENSVKYMGRSGTIVMTIEEIEPGKALLIYKDDGKGMDPVEAKKIFEKGFRGSNSEYGTGMGMYYVEEVVKAHCGSIDVLTDHDRGMCFYIRIGYRACE